MELARYLDRIGFDAPIATDLATLKALHRAHLLAIPYENLDVQMGRRRTTSPAEAYEKIVGEKRGGWCYEMNGTFGWALKEAGFKVTRLAGAGSEPHSHLVLSVDLEGETWIADVGFADGPLEPFRLTPGPFEQRGFAFSIDDHGDGRWRLNNHPFGAAKGYDCGGPDEPAMADRCQWLQTAPESVFVQNAVIFHHDADGGFSSLIGKVLRRFTAEAPQPKRIIENADDYVAALKDVFDLDFPAAASVWPKIEARHEELFGAAAGSA
ncbi:MAG: arylamine N-acetyltransferase [Caulobacteraceae bacterium]